MIYALPINKEALNYFIYNLEKRVKLKFYLRI